MLVPSTIGTRKTGLTTEGLCVRTGRNGYRRLRSILDYRAVKLQFSFVYAIEGMLLIDPMMLKHIKVDVSTIASWTDVDGVLDWKHDWTALQWLHVIDVRYHDGSGGYPSTTAIARDRRVAVLGVCSLEPIPIYSMSWFSAIVHVDARNMLPVGWRIPSSCHTCRTRCNIDIYHRILHNRNA
jgi:hypothetical protein